MFSYIDDILIASVSAEEHAHLRIVLTRLKKFGLSLNLDKCVIGVAELTFLGHRVNSEGCISTTEKIEAIQKFLKPKMVKDLRQFLGMLNFYPGFLRNAASVQTPLHIYLQDSRKNDKRVINWSAEAEVAFENAKASLAKQTMLAHPSPDARTRLVTDASDFTMSALNNTSKILGNH